VLATGAVTLGRKDELKMATTTLRNSHVNGRLGKRCNQSQRKKEDRGEHCYVFLVEKNEWEGGKRVKDAESDDLRGMVQEMKERKKKDKAVIYIVD
jgi:hypothetical protein